MEKNWKYYYDEGIDYSSAAKNSLEDKEKFNNELIYNIASLAIEKLLVSIFLFHNKLPESGTLEGIANELSEFVPVGIRFMDEMLFISEFNYYCSLEVEKPRIPDDDQIRRIVGFIDAVIDLAKRETAQKAMA